MTTTLLSRQIEAQVHAHLAQIRAETCVAVERVLAFVRRGEPRGRPLLSAHQALIVSVCRSAVACGFSSSPGWGGTGGAESRGTWLAAARTMLYADATVSCVFGASDAPLARIFPASLGASDDGTLSASWIRKRMEGLNVCAFMLRACAFAVIDPMQ